MMWLTAYAQRTTASHIMGNTHGQRNTVHASATRDPSAVTHESTDVNTGGLGHFNATTSRATSSPSSPITANLPMVDHMSGVGHHTKTSTLIAPLETSDVRNAFNGVTSGRSSP